MKTLRMIVVIMAVMVFLNSEVWAHQPDFKKNPTNENGIEFGIENAIGFDRWRAYVNTGSDFDCGDNIGWKNSGNGWWYYDLDSISQRVMWRLNGMTDRSFLVTYWVYRSDGTWEYGPQVNVISDQILPVVWFDNLDNGQNIDKDYYNMQVSSYDGLSGVDAIRIYAIVPSGETLQNWTPSGITNQYYMEFDFEMFVHQFNFPAQGDYTFTLWVKDKAGNITYEPGGQINIAVDLGQVTPPPIDPPPVDPPPVDPPPLDLTYAYSFVYPMDCEIIYRTESTDSIPIGACYDYQPYGSLFGYLIKLHLGHDINLRGINDLGAPVYSIANGLIWDVGWTSGWGNYLIIEYKAQPGDPFRLPDGSTETTIYALYAHLDDVFIIKDNGEEINYDSIIEKQTQVAKGWQIGTVGDGNGIYSPHLHFEVRKSGYSQLGYGYWPINDLSYLDYFVDGIEFIDNNRASDDNPTLSVYVHGYDLDPGRNSYLELNSSQWTRQGRVKNWPLESVGWANHLWLTSSSNDYNAIWHFTLPQSGTWSVYAIIPRYYAQANGVKYNVWHGDISAPNPKQIILDQENDDQNIKAPLGTYYFEQGFPYMVDVSSLTNDYPAKNVGIDTLILVYEGDQGAGGNLPSEDDMVTVFTEGDISFTYNGPYNEPKLFCQGAGMSWGELYLSNGNKEGSVNVSWSEEVICNIQFEDNSWMTDWQGIRTGHYLYVDGLKITAVKDNGIGGTNLVFNVQLTGTDNNEDENTSKSVGGKSSSGSGGCTIVYGHNTSGLINLLVIMLPALIIMIGRRHFKTLSS